MEGLGAIIEKMVTNPQPPKRGEAGWQVPASSSRESQKTESDTEKDDYKVSSKDADKYGGSKAPEPATCEYCGATLYYGGIRSFTKKNEVMIWFKEPERCTCEKAKAYWADYEARKAAEEKAEEARKEAERIQARVNRLFKGSGIRGRFRNRTFEKFEVTPENKRAYGVARRYADSFHERLPKKDERGNIKPPAIERNGLLIVGSYGTGKTHLATAIANQLITTGTPVIAMTMIDLLARIKQSYDGSENANEADIMKIYEEVPLLIIDDIGSEQPTEWGITRIYAIINARYEAYMPVIVTTNYGADELIRRMTPGGAGKGDSRNAEKTLDRLKEMCEGVEMFWDSWRSR